VVNLRLWVEAKAAPCHDAVQVRVKVQFAAPGVQDRSDAELGTEPLWDAAQLEQGAGGRLEQ